MLPQQLLMLMVVARAFEQAGLDECDRAARECTGVFVGIELDLNTTNFHLRWWCRARARDWLARRGVASDAATGDAWVRACCDTISVPLDANRTMGSLGGIVASRIARSLRIGGPAFTVANTDCSGLRALALATRSLQRGEIDTAIVGAVEFVDPRARPSTPMKTPAGEGAVACILKRHSDAIAEGDPILAVIKGIGDASDVTTESAHHRALERALDEASACREQMGLHEVNREAATLPDAGVFGEAASLIGHTGAASGLAAFARASLSLHHRLLPLTYRAPTGERQAARYWLHNRSNGARHAAVSAFGADGVCLTAVLQAAEGGATECGIVRDNAVLFPIYGATPAVLLKAVRRLGEMAHATPDLHVLSHNWWRAHREQCDADYRAVIVCDDPAAIAALLDQLSDAITAGRTVARDGVYFSTAPLAQSGRLAFVYPGSGSHFDGMGIELGRRFPNVLERLHAENAALAGQFADGKFWRGSAASLNHRDVIFGQVWIGSFVTDVIAQFGVSPDAVIGYSLGETAGLFAMRAWVDRDAMLERIEASDLFTDELVGACRAAAQVWQLDDGEAVDWVVGVVNRSQAEVATALARTPAVGARAYLLIVNTPNECVVGGARRATQRLVADLACQFHALDGVSTVHCEAAEPVKAAYRALHLFDTRPPDGVTFYSGVAGGAYAVTRDSAADSIVGQATQAFDYTRVIESAYTDGVRFFVEMGPGKSCTRMIRQILGDRPHAAVALCVKDEDGVANTLHCLAGLIAEHVPVTLDPLFAASPSAPAMPANTITVATHRAHVTLPPAPAAPPPGSTKLAAGMQEKTGEAMARTDAVFRRIAHTFDTLLAAAPPASAGTIVFDRAACLEIATGSIGRVLGEAFADIDDYPTRVRLPDEPLMLVDRIIALEGTPNGLVSDPAVTGRVVTEHDVKPGAWYLDGGVIPTAMAVESGQADLFLSGYLGIDHLTHGLAVYRLLDAKITFHDDLPGVGETIRYHISIDGFFRQNETWLFRFHFRATVNDKLFLTMTDGLAGFFTPAELAASGGVVRTSLEQTPQPTRAEAAWLAPRPAAVESYDDAALEALRRGDLAACFGGAFAAFRGAETLPGGRLKLVHRILALDPDGGRYHLGHIVGEADIHPDDWFLVCHFVDDPVMPGTLMYECCLHTLRVYLMRFGWVGEADAPCCQPVIGAAGQLKCRGQVVATTRKVRYAITIKRLCYTDDGTPTVIADALMYADDRAIVRMDGMSLRLSGLKADHLAARWRRAGRRTVASKQVLFDGASILAFAAGKPSEAFGAPYRVFDGERVIARLPRPPYQFLDRIVDLQNCQAFELQAGGRATAEYDVPADAWYFAANRQPEIPFAILLEVALQPCGWLAAYLGSALTSTVDLSFRNLGGNGTRLRPVTASSGTLTTTITLDKVSQSAGMIIQNYTLEVRSVEGVVYRGDTYFGFFPKQALVDQVGIRDAERDGATAAVGDFDYPDHAPYPDATLRMIDTIRVCDPAGGRHGLGFLRGEIDVDPEAWFFDAHFYQDPVWPGSLGLESFLQLLKVFAVRRWRLSEAATFETPVCGEAHRWTYRGQIIPVDRRVAVEATITAIDDAGRRLRADGFLIVDERVIYRMNEFTLLVND